MSPLRSCTRARFSFPAITALALAAAAVLPAHAQNISPKDEVKQFTLANGMTLIVKPDHRAPTVANLVMLRVGSMDEVDGTSGVAHAVEHMMFKGTPDLKVGEFSRRVAALGGRENAFTGRDATGYHQQVPAAKLEDVVKLEADRFARNQWPDDEFRREIEVIKEERRLRTEDSPRSMMYEAANAMTFTASPYRRPVIGWMNDLDALTPNDVREFYRRWYVPANAVVVIAGDVEPAEALRLAQKYYGAIPAGAVPVRKPREEPPQFGIRRMDYKAPASQSVVALSFKVPKIEGADLMKAPPAAGTVAAQSPGRDALALTVLSAVLDGYAGARLQRSMEQGGSRLADSAGSSNGLLGRGPQLFSLSAVPADGKTADQVIAALREQITKIAAEGVSEAELNRVKTQWMAAETYKLDAVFSQARELGSNWINGLPLDASERMIAHLRTITSAEVQAVAARYFGDDQLTISTLLPQPIDPNRKPRTPRATVPAGRD
ncbi:MAG: insulinase family protein [Comamonadaceae bacterium]|nr:MAG: insulinase family protein [Comamonadaceae bacterium]